MWTVVGEEGFEPPTPWFVATCSNPLSYRPRLHQITNIAFRSVEWEKKNAGVGFIFKKK